jgi:uncharacterized membrane protein
MTDTNAPNVDSSGPQLAAGKSPRKGLVIALITSVVINLLFIGALAGRLINGPPPSPMREQLRPQLEAHARQVKPLRRSMQQAQRDLKSALGTDPLDEAQLTAALLELRTASNNLQISMHAAMFTLVKQLEPAQRTRIAQFLSRSERGKQRRPSESDNHKD